jgi:F0F1-type ATP synthase membrane subunit c/vacuolar-type H+-ATPase subunit K
MSDDRNAPKPPRKSSGLPPGSGVALGIVFGVAIGTALGNTGIGIALGIAIGSAFDVTQRAKKNKNDDKDGE